MMQFGSTNLHSDIVDCIKKTLKKYDIIALRADDKEYMDDLFSNVKTYLHACDFGIAVFERITEDDFNPNVTLEVGYMFGLGKKVLLLKDQTLTLLTTDLTGKLYKQFDTTDVLKTMPDQIEKWLSDKGVI
jgi:nucleoside 2-deoxyribosyltransferase